MEIICEGCRNVRQEFEWAGAKQYICKVTNSCRNAYFCEDKGRDFDGERMCMNCKHYLWGGDWGLACDKDYYKLPSPTDVCEEFEKQELVVEE